MKRREFSASLGLAATASAGALWPFSNLFAQGKPTVGADFLALDKRADRTSVV